MENLKAEKDGDANSSKPDAESGESKTDMIQHEKLIDPGNEHSHHVEEEKKPGENKEARFEAEAGDGTTGP